MAENKIRRKVVWETSGVSEIIGTILMLSITVVLFSSIITFVSNMPAPRQTFVVELKCSLQPVDPDNWGNGVNFRILHQGGQVMDPLWTQIYITVNNSNLPAKSVTDGLIDSNPDGKWGVGEYWVYLINGMEVVPAVTLTSDSTYSITIVDQERNTLVWHETLGEGANYYAPIIKRAWIDSDTETPEVDDAGPIGFEKEFKVYAEIVDPEGIGGENGLNTSDLWVNLNSMFFTPIAPVRLQDKLDTRDATDDNIYVALCTGPTKIPVGYYYFKFNATDNSGKSTEFITKFPVGMIVGEKPQIVVKGDHPITGKYDYITFSNPEPTNGDTIDITATILNIGGRPASVNVDFYKDSNDSVNYLGSALCNVAEGGQQDASISWVASPGGIHMIIVEAQVIGETSDFYDFDKTDNANHTHLSVMPKILLVDDDAYINDQSDGDTVSVMRASLEAADFEYDYVAVGSGDGPGYDYGDYPLKKYDVVIWMTGYTTSKTLTVSNAAWADRTDDVANLQMFLTGSPLQNPPAVPALNGGSLWLIGEGIWTEANLGATPGPELRAFAQTYLHIPTLPNNIDALPPLYGNETHPVTDYWANSSINTVERVIGTGDANYWEFTDIADKYRIALDNAAPDAVNRRVYALSYDSDNASYAPADPIDDSRILAQTWGFSRIKDTATQAQYAYKAVLWLGKITSKFTQDVAISEQTIEPETVFYKQQVTINFVVRNNGLNTYTTADNLWYLLRIMDMDGNDRIPPYLQRIPDLGTLSNNTIHLSYNWTPQEIGYHRISIKIDPYNYIEESNELNNEISSYWGTGELNVLYRVLVVDDDESVNNGAGRSNETLQVTNALDYLGYDYENCTVSTGDNGPAYDGGNGTALNEYNAVIWVIGEASATPLTALDIVNITRYMNLGGNFWLLGSGLDGVDDAGFEQLYMKIASITANQGMATVLRGVEDDAVSHGMEYACNNDVNADVLVPMNGSSGFIYQNNAMSLYNSVRFEGATPVNPLVQYRTAATAWALSSLSSDLSKAEFVFMMLRWFDKPEDRIETRIANVDVWLSDNHPQLGSGYVIQAQVQNTGGSTGNVLVRFMDGNTQIGSDSISVSPNSWTTAEIVWVPLFAGQRTLKVQLDPIAEVDEIFEWTNNNATRSIYVYFFWDDMESGAGKWSHSSTIALINGEGPLEYFGNTATSVNIEKDWDYTMSVGVNNATDTGFYHTHDKATWLQEPRGTTTTTTTITRPPMDIVFALDNSGSMAGAKFTNLQSAAQQFIGKLVSGDRAAIYTFSGTVDWDNNPYRLRDWSWMNTTAQRSSFNTSIQNLAIENNAGTPFYDTLGEAIVYSLTYDATATDTIRHEYVLGLTDGASNSDDYYTPELAWGATSNLAGIDPNGYANNGGVTAGNGFTGGIAHGVYGAPPMVFQIGLSLGTDHWNSYPTDGFPLPGYDETYTDSVLHNLEYDLWHCANSTPAIRDTALTVPANYGYNNTAHDAALPAWCQPRPNIGHYYHCTDPTKLGSIFDAILTSIQIGSGNLSGEDQTRSSVPQPGTMSAPPGSAPNAVFTQTRYMRGDSHTINGLNTYQLGITQSATRRTISTAQIYAGTGQTVTWGIRVWRRTAAPVENEITTGTMVATVSRNANAAGLQNANWNCPGLTPLATTDAIVVRVYCQVGATAAVQQAEFITEQLTANQLDATTWTVYYYTTRSTGTGSGGWTRGTFDFGLTPYDSRITNFQWSTISATTATATDPTGGPTNVGGINILYSFTGTPASVNLYYTTNGGTNWILAGNDATVDGIFPYTLVTSGVYGWYASAVGGTPASIEIAPASGTAPEATAYTFDNVRPYVSNTVPANGATNVALTPSDIVITFSETMNILGFTYTVEPNPGGLAIAWSGATNTIATITHTAFLVNSRYWVNITAATDPASNLLNPTPYSFYFDTIQVTSATATGPIGGPTNVAAITITYTWVLSPTAVNIYYTVNGGGAWALAGTDATVDGSYAYTLTVSGTYGWIAQAVGGAPASTEPKPPAGGTVPEVASYIFDNVKPTVVTVPANMATGIATNANVVLTFSEAMNTGTFAYTMEPDPGGRAVAWTVGNTVATITHTNFQQNTRYWVNITTATDPAGNTLNPTPYSFYFTTLAQATATATGPLDVSNINVITIAYTYTSTPTSVNLYYTKSAASPYTWVLAGNDVTVDGSYIYTIAAGDGAYGWLASAVGGSTVEPSPPANTVPPEATQYFLDRAVPASNCNPVGTYWQNTATTITATATDAAPSSGIATVTLWYRYTINNATWNAWTSFGADPASPWSWSFTFPKGNGFYEFYTIARDNAGNVESAPAIADLKLGYMTTGGGIVNPGLSPDGDNTNKSAVTKPMDLTNQDTATLEFWHKYNMVPGANGGVLMVGFKESAAGPYKWRYVVPSSAYTGNLRLNVTHSTREDSMGTFIQWGWNGISGRGTFAWEKVSLNLLPWVNATGIAGYEPLSEVRIKFQYYQYGGGTGYGWYIDDVRVTVSRSNSVTPDSAAADVWRLIDKRVTNPLDPQYHPLLGTNHTHSGNCAWWNGDPVTGLMKPGIDNYLMSSPIDLTNARTANLSAYVKFNLNYASGAPPDGFRVEITKDNGVTWSAVNLGVRSSWNVSGTDADSKDGYPGDGKSYTGITDSGVAATDSYWVSVGSLTRINIDLSSFSGNAIQIRFRVINNFDSAYAHSNNANQANPGFGGFYVDDVQIKGETILG